MKKETDFKPYFQTTAMSTKTFPYSASDFNFEVRENSPKSTLDTLLHENFEKAQENKVCRYTLNIKNWKVLPGKYGLLTQLNLDRALNRRDPLHVVSLTQPFDPQKFNFLKVPEEEIYFSLNEDDVFIVNASPLEFGHCLFVPQRKLEQSQTMTKYSLQKAIELFLTSNSPNLRVVFNSIGGLASVNHLHLHFYYLKHRMLLETKDLASFVGPVCILENFASNGFCAKLSLIENHDVQKFVNVVYFLIEFLQGKNVAHNVYITRGKSNEEMEVFDDVRVYVWARKPIFGVKESASFLPAACELFGHLVIRGEEAFEKLQEDDVCNELGDATLEVFRGIRDGMKVALEDFLKRR